MHRRPRSAQGRVRPGPAPDASRRIASISATSSVAASARPTLIRQSALFSICIAATTSRSRLPASSASTNNTSSSAGSARQPSSIVRLAAIPPDCRARVHCRQRQRSARRHQQPGDQQQIGERGEGHAESEGRHQARGDGGGRGAGHRCVDGHVAMRSRPVWSACGAAGPGPAKAATETHRCGPRAVPASSGEVRSASGRPPPSGRYATAARQGR